MWSRKQYEIVWDFTSCLIVCLIHFCVTGSNAQGQGVIMLSASIHVHVNNCVQMHGHCTCIVFMAATED